MLLRALAYKVHPYRWAAIGLATDHIAGATLADVESFYRAHYRPSNAILSISADMEEERMLELAEKWFAPLADHPSATAAIPQEPMQTQARRQEVERDVPASTVTVAYHMCARTKPDFYTADLVSDLLSGGDSGRLYTHLVKERNLLSSVNAYITGDVDPGLFVFTGQLLPGVTPEAAEAAFREEIEALQTTVATAYEIEKVKNKFEANTLFGELERDEQGDEPRVLRDAGRPLPDQPRGGPLPRRHRRGHPLVQPPHASARKQFHTHLQRQEMTQPRITPSQVEVAEARRTTLPNGIGLYTARLRRFRGAAHLVRLPRRIALQQAPFSASAAATSSSDGVARHDGAPRLRRTNLRPTTTSSVDVDVRTRPYDRHYYLRTYLPYVTVPYRPSVRPSVPVRPTDRTVPTVRTVRSRTVPVPVPVPVRPVPVPVPTRYRYRPDPTRTVTRRTPNRTGYRTVPDGRERSDRVRRRNGPTG